MLISSIKTTSVAPQRGLQAFQRGVREFLERAKLEMMDQAVDRRRVEAQVKRSTASRSRDAHEVSGQTLTYQNVLDLLQRRLHCRGFACAGGAQEQESQGLQGQPCVSGEERFHVLQNHIDQ